VHLDTIKVCLPNDAQLNRLKNNFKIYTKPAPTCFGGITLFDLAKVALVKITN